MSMRFITTAPGTTSGSLEGHRSSSEGELEVGTQDDDAVDVRLLRLYLPLSNRFSRTKPPASAGGIALEAATR